MRRLERSAQNRRREVRRETSTRATPLSAIAAHAGGLPRPGSLLWQASPMSLAAGRASVASVYLYLYFSQAQPLALLACLSVLLRTTLRTGIRLRKYIF